MKNDDNLNAQLQKFNDVPWFESKFFKNFCLKSTEITSGISLKGECTR